MSDTTASLIKRFNAVLTKAEDADIARIEKALDGAFNDLERQLSKAIKETSGLSLLNSQRSMTIILQISHLLNLFNQSGAPDLSNLTKQASDVGLEFSAALIAATDPSAVVLHSTVPIEAMSYASEAAVQKLLGIGATYADTAAATITQGLATGWGVKRVSSVLASQVGIVKSRAEAVVRTASIEAQDNATRQNYKDNSIEQVIRVATEDIRVCGYCAARAGKIYNLDEAPAAIHYNDRCYNAPYKQSWVDLGLQDLAWFENHAAEVRSRCQETINYGPAPFEKKGGLTSAPKTIKP